MGTKGKHVQLIELRDDESPKEKAIDGRDTVVLHREAENDVVSERMG